MTATGYTIILHILYLLCTRYYILYVTYISFSGPSLDQNCEGGGISKEASFKQDIDTVFDGNFIEKELRVIFHHEETLDDSLDT